MKSGPHLTDCVDVCGVLVALSVRFGHCGVDVSIASIESGARDDLVDKQGQQRVS